MKEVPVKQEPPKETPTFVAPVFDTPKQHTPSEPLKQPSFTFGIAPSEDKLSVQSPVATDIAKKPVSSEATITKIEPAAFAFEPKPSVPTPQSTAVELPKPSFTFGEKALPEPKEPTPAFSFTAEPSSVKKVDVPAEPVFSFGKTEQAATTPTPTPFSFEPAKPVQSVFAPQADQKPQITFAPEPETKTSTAFVVPFVVPSFPTSTPATPVFGATPASTPVAHKEEKPAPLPAVLVEPERPRTASRPTSMPPIVEDDDEPLSSGREERVGKDKRGRKSDQISDTETAPAPPKNFTPFTFESSQVCERKVYANSLGNNIFVWCNAQRFI